MTQFDANKIVNSPTRASERDIRHVPTALPAPRARRATYSCMECEALFSSTSLFPECPSCGGVDVEPR